jgi:peptide/nickel transport system substrate-binding protein
MQSMIIMEANMMSKSGFRVLVTTLAAFFIASPLPVMAVPDANTLVIAQNTTVNTLDPHNTASVATDLSVISHLYSSLVIRDADLKIKPAVAKSWQQLNDKTWRIDLAPNAVFENGEKMDAAAVKWNIDHVRDPKVNARVKAWFDLVQDVKVISPTRLDIATSAPYPTLMDQLSMFFLLPPKWGSENNVSRQAVSGGPYKLISFVPGDSIVLEPNPRYWGPKPAYSKVVFRVIPEASSRIAALLAGEVDLVTGIPPSEMDRINRSGKAVAGAVPSIRSVFVKLNTNKPPLKDNKKFRQALNYAVDKESISRTLFNGKAELSNCQVLTPSYFGYNPDLKPYPYDPAKAKALMAESGVAPGTQIEFDVPIGVYLQSSEVAQAVASQFEEIGLSVKINEMEFGTYMNKYIKAKDLARMSYLGQAWPTIDADGLLTLFAPGNPYAYWENSEFGKLLTDGRTSMTTAKRLAAYRQATKVMCEEAPVVFLFAQPATYAYSKRVQWMPRGDDWVRAFDFKHK